MDTIKITFSALCRLLIEANPKKELSIFQCHGNKNRVWIAWEDTQNGLLVYDFENQYAFGLSEACRKIFQKQELDNPFRD